jgi:hypothetical protein
MLNSYNEIVKEAIEGLDVNIVSYESSKGGSHYFEFNSNKKMFRLRISNHDAVATRSKSDIDIVTCTYDQGETACICSDSGLEIEDTPMSLRDHQLRRIIKVSILDCLK